jgi:hypothetical protein
MQQTPRMANTLYGTLKLNTISRRKLSKIKLCPSMKKRKHSGYSY